MFDYNLQVEYVGLSRKSSKVSSLPFSMESWLLTKLSFASAYLIGSQNRHVIKFEKKPKVIKFFCLQKRW